MSTCDPSSPITWVMDAWAEAKSGKSFLVTGMGSGNDLKFEVESGGDLDQKKSHAYSN